MRPSQARFVTACQQLLVLGAVLAVLAPAASVVTLDVVGQPPPGSGPQASAAGPGAGLSAYGRETRKPSVLPAGPVDAEVSEYPLTTPPVGRRGVGAATPRAKVGALAEATRLTSAPVAVEGYGGVGLTWDPDVDLDDHHASFSVRTRSDGAWSEWTEMPYHDEHAPDPGSPDARGARPGTDLVLVGQVDEVQVRGVLEDGAVPGDLRMAVTAPGLAERTERELPALRTTGSGEEEVPEPAAAGDGLALQSLTRTPRPVIYSRAQWGANESLRDKGSLRYFEVHAGFVHHTVNANDYSRSQVPGILRSIYAYHTQSRGWSDVGYNFLVDKFGRIWEGRAGGVDRPVVGAHTLGYNDYSFAMSAIGNFETRRPPSAMLQAYGSLMAWKLSLHGVTATSSKQQVGSRELRAINGHRDAGSTACPGRYLYAQLGAIRKLAGQAQRGWSGRELHSDLASTRYPDLVLRRARDKQLFVLPTGGLLALGSPRRAVGVWAGADAVVASPDLTGDRLGDLLVRGKDGTARVRPGTASGFGSPIKATSKFAGRQLITAVGDLDEDGHNDLVARDAATGRLDVYLGGGGGGFERRSVPGDWSRFDRLAATGDVDGDGHVDLLARDRDGRLWRFPGTGAAGFRAVVEVPGEWGRYDTITGFGDFDRTGGGDLVVRTKGGPGWVRPGRGDGTFARGHGPINGLATGGRVSGAQVAGNRAPDVVVRRGDDLVVLVHRGTWDTRPPIPTGVRAPGINALLNAGDWDGDGHGDVITRRADDGVLQLRRGNGRGGLAAPVRLATGFAGVRLLAAVGDMTGDGRPDLMGQPGTGAMRIYPGKGLNGLRKSYVAHSRIDSRRHVAVGRWTGDGAPDSLLRKGDRLVLFPGNGPGGLTTPRSLGLDVGAYDWIIGVSDVRATGHGDVIVRDRRKGLLHVLHARTSGFQSRRYLAEGMARYDMAG